MDSQHLTLSPRCTDKGTYVQCYLGVSYFIISLRDLFDTSCTVHVTVTVRYLLIHGVVVP